MLVHHYSHYLPSTAVTWWQSRTSTFQECNLTDSVTDDIEENTMKGGCGSILTDKVKEATFGTITED